MQKRGSRVEDPGCGDHDHEHRQPASPNDPEENKRSKQIAEEAQTSSAIRAELQRLGVAKVDLAFKAIRDDIVRSEDGRLIAHGLPKEVLSDPVVVDAYLGESQPRKRRRKAVTPRR